MNPTDAIPRRRRKFRTRILLLLRRVHLYVGLFLLPWVFLYGVTGALFNHYNLLPDSVIQDVDARQLSASTLADFPSPDELARQVVAAMREADPDAEIEWNPSHPPQFSNPLTLQLKSVGTKHAIHIDPVNQSASVVTFAADQETAVPMLSELQRVQLDPNPHRLAEQAVPDILREAGIDSHTSLEPVGWTKLNFLATVNGQPARVTYVLRDGHLDVTQYKAEDGFSTRAFLMRLHTSHGQPPHWNARRVWSLFIDAMAIAMVTWGVTGLLMWWQIKRTRLVGGVVIVLSVATALVMYLGMQHFYATNQL